MTFDWWTFGLQTVNAVVLVWLLARFLFRPVSRIIAERQVAAHAALDEAKAANEAASNALADAQAQRDAVTRERAALIAAAEAEAEKLKQKLLEAAQTEAKKSRAEAEADLARLRTSEAQHWRAEAGALAVDMTEKLLNRLPGGARAADFSDSLAEAVEKLPQATRDRIGADGPVTLCAAHDLTASERALVSDRLAEALGRAVALQFVTDASLIAGLELHTPHAVIRNTFRADLDRIAERIATDDRA